MTGTARRLRDGSSIAGWATGGQFGTECLGPAVNAKGNVDGAVQWFGSTGVCRFDRTTGHGTLITGTEERRAHFQRLLDRARSNSA